MMSESGKVPLRILQFSLAIAFMFAFEMAVDSMVIHPVSRSVESDGGKGNKEGGESLLWEERNITGDPWIDQLTDPPLKSKRKKKKTVVYSLKRSDRSGEIIRDMMLCLKYCRKKRWTYGGACPLRRLNMSQEREEERLNITRSIIKSIGLQNTLAFRCPPKKHIDTSRSAGPKHKLLPDHKLRKLPRRLGLLDRSEYAKGIKSNPFSPEYIQYLRSKMQPEDTSQNDNATKPYTIVAHVRRGDVAICNKWASRYIPNGYFINLIEQYKADYRKKKNDPNSPVRVIVHTEAVNEDVQQIESDEDFRDLGYDVSVQESEAQVWKDIIHEADVVLLSISTFSILPAKLGDPKRTEYVYFPYPRVPPLPEWRIATETEVKMSNDLREGLKQKCNME